MNAPATPYRSLLLSTSQRYFVTPPRAAPRVETPSGLHEHPAGADELGMSIVRWFVSRWFVGCAVACVVFAVVLLVKGNERAAALLLAAAA